MNPGPTVFAQLMAHAPHKAFVRCVEQYRGSERQRRFSPWDQYLAMAFAQLTYRESLRDIEACLGAVPEKRYHLGFRSRVTRSTLADANERRDWRIYAAFAHLLIAEARRLYAGEPLDVELKQTVYALDSTTIDLCLALFPWAHAHRAKGAVKIHTLLDLRGAIPAFLWITEGNVNDVRILDLVLPEPGAIYLVDRGYIDYGRLHRFSAAHAVFVTRAKRNLQCRRLRSYPVDRSTGLVCDQTILLTGYVPSREYPESLRRIRYRDPKTGKTLVFLTNDFSLPAQTVADLYRCRWQVEIFFKWIKQHLRIRAFYGTSPNAVRTQIWIAISVYVLVAILRKRLGIERDLYTMLQLLSVYAFEKVPLPQLLSKSLETGEDEAIRNQLPLFDF
jgi:hypothetical protein